MSNDFKLCPWCGSSTIENVKNRKWKCPECGFDLYNNVASAVGLLIADQAGNVLFEKRAKEPRKGFLAFPGGFVDPDESAEEACYRECLEEAGVKPESIKYIASFPNTYEYKGITYKTCDMFFEAILSADCELKGQESEVECFEKVLVKTEQDVEKIPLAFESARKVLKLWVKNK